MEHQKCNVKKWVDSIFKECGKDGKWKHPLLIHSNSSILFLRTSSLVLKFTKLTSYLAHHYPP